jgi:hypothetical protein
MTEFQETLGDKHVRSDVDDDNISILTPSTVSSDDLDIDFMSDDSSDDRCTQHVDFSRLPKQKVIAAVPEQLGDLPSLHYGESSLGPPDIGNVFVHVSSPVVHIDDDQYAVPHEVGHVRDKGNRAECIAEDVNISNVDESDDEEESAEEEDDDDESIGWAPTPVKSSGVVNETKIHDSSSSQISSVTTLKSLMDKFNSCEGTQLDPSGLGNGVPLSDIKNEQDDIDSSYCSSDSDHKVSVDTYSCHGSDQLEVTKKQFYKITTNNISILDGNDGGLVANNDYYDIDSSTTCSYDSDHNNYADNEMGNESTRKPPPPAKSPPVESLLHPGSERQGILRNALSSILGVQEDDESSENSELVDQLSRYDESNFDQDSDQDSDSDEEGCNNSFTSTPLSTQRQRSPEKHQQQTQQQSLKLKESLFILEELNAMDDRFGQAPMQPPAPPPPPPRQIEKPKTASQPPLVAKDTFPIFAGGPKRHRPINTRGQMIDSVAVPEDNDADSSDTESVGSSDKEISRLIDILPDDSTSLAEMNYSELDEDDPIVEDTYNIDKKLVERLRYEEIQEVSRKSLQMVDAPAETETLDHSLFAEPSSTELFTDSLNRQELYDIHQARNSSFPPNNVQQNLSARKVVENDFIGSSASSPLRSPNKVALNTSQLSAVQKSRKEALIAFRKSDKDTKGYLNFGEFCSFLELSGFFPVSSSKPSASETRSPLIVNDESFFSRGVKPRIQNSVQMRSSSATTRAERQRQVEIKKKCFLLAHTCGSFDESHSHNCRSITDICFKDLVFHEEVNSVSLNDVVSFLDTVSGNKTFKDKILARLVSDLRNRRLMFKRSLSSNKSSQLANRGSSRNKSVSPTKTDITLAEFSRQTLPQSPTKSVVTCSTFFSERGADYGLSSDEAREVYRERRWNKVLVEATQAKEKELTFHPKLNSKPPPPPPPPPIQNNGSSPFMLSELDTSLPPPELQLSSSGKSLAYTNMKNFDKQQFKESKTKSSADIEYEEHCRFTPKINGISPFVSERELSSITKRANASAPPPPPPPRSGIVKCGQSLQQAKETEIMTIPLDSDLNIYYYNAKACPPVSLPVVIPDAPALPGSAWLAFTERDTQKSKVNYVIKKKSAAEKEALAKAKPAFGSLLEELNFKLKGIGTENSLIKLKPLPVSQKLNMGSGSKKNKKQKSDGFENLMDEMKFMLSRLNKSRDGKDISSSDEEESADEENEDEIIRYVEKPHDEPDLDGIKKGNLNDKLMAMLVPKEIPPSLPVEECKQVNPSDLRMAVERNRFNIPAAPPLPGMPAWAAPISYQVPQDDFSENPAPPLHLSPEESSDSRPPGYYLPAPDHVEILPGQVKLAAKVGEHEGIDYLVQVRIFREQEHEFRAKRRVSLASQLVKSVNETRGRGGLRTGDIVVTPFDIETVRANEYDDELTVISCALKNRKTPQDLPVPNQYYEDIERKRDIKKYRENLNQIEWNNGMRNYNEKEMKKKNHTYLDSVTKPKPFSFSTTARKRDKVISFRPRPLPASKELAITEFVNANSGFLNQTTLEGDIGAKLWTGNLRNHSLKQKGLNENAAPLITPSKSQGKFEVKTIDPEKSPEITRGGLPRSYPLSPRGKPEAPTLHYYNRSERKAVLDMRKKEEERKEKQLQELKIKKRKNMLREKAKAVMMSVNSRNEAEHWKFQDDKKSASIQSAVPSSFARSLSKLTPQVDVYSIQHGDSDSVFLNGNESVFSKASASTNQYNNSADNYMSDEEEVIDHTIYHTLNVDVDLSSFCDEEDSVLQDYYDTDNVSIHSMYSDENGNKTSGSEIMTRKCHTPLKRMEERRQKALEAVSAEPPKPPPQPQRQGFSRMPSMNLGNAHTADTPNWQDTSKPSKNKSMAPEFKDSRVKYREMAALKSREEVVQRRLDRANPRKSRDERKKGQNMEEEPESHATHRSSSTGGNLHQQNAHYADNPDLEEARKLAGIIKPKTNLKMLFGDLDEVHSEEDKRGFNERQNDEEKYDNDDDPIHDTFNMNVLQEVILRRNSDMMAQEIAAQERRSSRHHVVAAAPVEIPDGPARNVENERESNRHVTNDEYFDEVEVNQDESDGRIYSEEGKEYEDILSPKKAPVRRASILFANIDLASESALKRTAALQNENSSKISHGTFTGNVMHNDDTVFQISQEATNVENAGSLEVSTNKPDPSILDNVRRLSGAGLGYGCNQTMDMRETMKQAVAIRRSLKATDYQLSDEQAFVNDEVLSSSGNIDGEESDDHSQGSTLRQEFPFQDLGVATKEVEQRDLKSGDMTSPVISGDDNSSAFTGLKDDIYNSETLLGNTISNELEEQSLSVYSLPKGQHKATPNGSLTSLDGSSVISNASSTFEQTIEGHKKKMNHVERRSLYDYNFQGGVVDKDFQRLPPNLVGTVSAARRRSSVSGAVDFSSNLHSAGSTKEQRRQSLTPEVQFEDILKGHKKKMHHVERQSLYAYNVQYKAVDENRSFGLTSTAENEDDESEDQQTNHGCQSSSGGDSHVSLCSTTDDGQGHVYSSLSKQHSVDIL